MGANIRNRPEFGLHVLDFLKPCVRRRQALRCAGWVFDDWALKRVNQFELICQSMIRRELQVGRIISNFRCI